MLVCAYARRGKPLRTDPYIRRVFCIHDGRMLMCWCANERARLFDDENERRSIANWSYEPYDG